MSLDKILEDVSRLDNVCQGVLNGIKISVEGWVKSAYDEGFKDGAKWAMKNSSSSEDEIKEIKDNIKVGDFVSFDIDDTYTCGIVIDTVDTNPRLVDGYVILYRSDNKILTCFCDKRDLKCYFRTADSKDMHNIIFGES